MPRPSKPLLTFALTLVLLVSGCRTIEQDAAPTATADDPSTEAEARAKFEHSRMMAEAEVRARQQAETEAREQEQERERESREAMTMSMPPPPPPPMETPDTQSVKNPNVDRQREFDEVRVFYATDRKATDTGTFGSGRGAGITYGTISVSVPREHQVGAIERPSIWRLEFSEDPRKHMVIVDRKEIDRDGFLDDIRKTMRAGGVDASFVFVHGYNVAFDDAARRTAQITYDLNFPGAPVFYSWQSQATLEGYTTDENNVEWSQVNLKGFLLDYAQNSDAGDIYLIAHSMGNRALTRAVTALFTEHPELRGRFKEIILTAPDIDADVFERDIAPKLVEGCDRITLYVSDGDKALLASKTVHGYPRLGDSSAGIVVVSGIETIDASGLDTSFLEHSYFAGSGSVLTDIRRLVREGLSAAQRGLKQIESGGETYWKIDIGSE